MSDEIIQGDWDDLIRRRDLHGRKVRVIVIDEEKIDNPWLKSLRAWADNHKPLGHPVDDSRDSVYSGSVDDPR
jgi:hypothetical protein